MYSEEEDDRNEVLKAAGQWKEYGLHSNHRSQCLNYIVLQATEEAVVEFVRTCITVAVK